MDTSICHTQKTRRSLSIYVFTTENIFEVTPSISLQNKQVIADLFLVLLSSLLYSF